MKHIKALFLSSSLLFAALCSSCGEQKTDAGDAALAQEDSTVLRVAVMPTEDCLPVFYALHAGLFRDEGVEVHLQTYNSQMDADTALLNRRAHIAYADMPRLLEMQGDSMPLRMLGTSQNQLYLVTAHSKRIRNYKHLKERMVAVERLSTADYLSDRIMEVAGLEQADIYRPQINDISLRCNMLTDQLVDAALLPEPYATHARIKGNKVFSDSLSTDFHGWAVHKNLLKKGETQLRLKKFIKAYNRSVKMLNENPNADSIRHIYKQHYPIPNSIADSIPNRHFKKLTPVDRELTKEALDWLLRRERHISPVACDSLLAIQKGIYANE